MSIQSMTGFSRSQGQFANLGWGWELRSVNGKSLDLRFRMPQGFEALEARIRKLVQGEISRGNIQISLQIDRSASQASAIVNDQAVDSILNSAKLLQTKIGGDLPTIAEILSVRGVVEFGETAMDAEEHSAFEKELEAGFKTGFADLVDARTREGGEISTFLFSQLDAMTEICEQIRNDPDHSLAAIREKLRRQVEELMGSSSELDPQRLHQEAALLATKADLQEELDRLEVHLRSARELIENGGPIGRKLDFICQEFNRECNTICSKSNSATVSSLGLDMKLMIDKFREQVQNME